MSEQPELTDEMIDDGINCESKFDCRKCKMNTLCREVSQKHFNAIILQALKAEKVKDYVWSKAKKYHVVANVVYQDTTGVKSPSVYFARKLPKSLIQIKAEKIYDALFDSDRDNLGYPEKDICNIIEILKEN